MKPNPWIFFTLALLIALVLPSLVQDGMFMDGMLYTSVSHNLALGKGSFWYPEFSSTSMTFFHEQPPLVFGIQAVFFRLLGDSLYVERFYSFLCTLINAGLIVLVWRRFFHDSPLKKIGWLPVVFWIIMPVTFWACSNNMQENTMSIFVLLATLFLFKGLQQETGRKKLFFFFPLAGFFLVLAALSKGFPGLFPLVLVPLHWLIFRRYSFARALLYSCIPLLSAAAIFALLLSNNHIYQSLHAYLFDRVVNSIQHVATHNNRFHLLSELFQNLLPVIGVSLLLFLAAWKSRSKNPDSESRRNVLFFLSLGLAGALPLMVTLEQRGFYLVTALPFFAFAFAALAGPSLLNLLSRWPEEGKSFRAFRWLSVLLVIAALIVSGMQVGKTRRDRDMLADIYTIGKLVPRGSTVSIDVSMWNDWSLQTYMMRYFSISLDHKERQQYLLLDKSLPQHLPPGYFSAPVKTRKYNLYYYEFPGPYGDGVD